MMRISRERYGPGRGTTATPRPTVAPEPRVPKAAPVRAIRTAPVLGSFKKGGKVKKTGAYRLHKGEQVMPLSSLMGGKR